MTLFSITFSYANSSELAADSPLTIPPMLDTKDGKEVHLVMQHGKHRFYSGIESNTMGFNGDYLGPTIDCIKAQKPTLVLPIVLRKARRCMDTVYMSIAILMGGHNWP